MKTIGYMWLVERYGLGVLPPPVTSFLLDRGHRRTRLHAGHLEEYYPPRDDPGEHWTDHLAFALKREGVNLEILASLLREAPVEELVAWIKSMPTSRYARKAWFLYEWLTGEMLPLPDLTQGNYVPLLDPERYYALEKGAGAVTSRRHRVLNNLTGTPTYCPLVRRTETLRQFEALRLDKLATRYLEAFPAELIYRAAHFLYMKETKSSFAIEHLSPDQRRSARFVSLLQQAGSFDCFASGELIRLQNAIVEDRYAAKAFRDFQNYVGQSLGPAKELIHFVPPKPDDLIPMMEGWAASCRALLAGNVHPVVTATVAGFGFVFLHPFEDGNGRLHRYLIHHVLAATGFSPPGVILPVSAAMLKQMVRYDATLEAYSRAVGRHVEYRLDGKGEMTVLNDTASLYRYPDLTVQAEALSGFLRDSLETELAAELDYLAAFDQARKAMRGVVDMPDRRMDSFLRACLQNKGRLSKTKRASFKELSDDECALLEKIVRSAIQGLKRKDEE